MDRHQYKSAAFAALSAVAQALLVHLTYKYNSNRMNDVWLSARDAAKRLNVSRSTAARKLLELEHYGFIVEVQGAHLGVDGIGTSAHYRLTAQKYGQVGATHDYDKWNGEIFSPEKRRKPPEKSRNQTKPWLADGVSRRTWYRRRQAGQNGTVAQNPVSPEGQGVSPEGHSGASPTAPESGTSVSPEGHRVPVAPSHQRDIASVTSSGRSRAVPRCADGAVPAAGIGHNAGPPLTDERPAWTTPVLTEIPYTDELRQLYAATESVNPLPDDGLTIPTFLRRA
jgi:hypothetical protein